MPIADCNARSTFLNLSGRHTGRDMMRAVYESVAYNIRWLVEIVSGEFGFPLPKLRAIGGGARSATSMQMLADVTHRRIETVPDPKEAGAVGAALVAAVGLGIYPNFEALESVTRVEKTYEPRQEHFKTYDPLYESFKQSYGRLRPFYRKMNETSGSTGLSSRTGISPTAQFAWGGAGTSGGLRRRTR